MILQELSAYYERLRTADEVPQAGFSMQGITFAVVT